MAEPIPDALPGRDSFAPPHRAQRFAALPCSPANFRGPSGTQAVAKCQELIVPGRGCSGNGLWLPMPRRSKSADELRLEPMTSRLYASTALEFGHFLATPLPEGDLRIARQFTTGFEFTIA